MVVTMQERPYVSGLTNMSLVNRGAIVQVKACRCWYTTTHAYLGYHCVHGCGLPSLLDDSHGPRLTDDRLGAKPSCTVNGS
jgi:hypothetical protein